MLIEIPENASRLTNRDKKFEHSVLIYIWISTVRINSLRVGCIVYLSEYTLLLYTLNITVARQHLKQNHAKYTHTEIIRIAIQ